MFFTSSPSWLNIIPRFNTDWFQLLVPGTGIEPVRTKNVRGILSPLRLPVPPPRQKNGGDTRIRTGDKGFAVLCLTAWLCRLNWSGRRDSNPRPSPWQGDALPLSHFRMPGAETQNRTGDTRIFSPLLYRLSYLGKNGGADGNRTRDLRRDRPAC